jgi:bifunctional NMN adenylyltransferase/nudix hydrolase
MTIGVVDIALVDKDRSRVLLARKPGEAEWRFPGGFCDPQAECYEDDAKRELAEETGLYGEDWHYVGSAHVDDWRYRGEPHQLRTTFFVATHTMGAPRPQDDVAELRWIGFDRLDQVQIVKEHQKLLPMLLKYLGG